MSLKPTRQSQPTKDLSLEQGVRWIEREPYYLPAGNEVVVFTTCHERGLPVMLKGPTGCGKTRFIEHRAAKLKRPLVTIACHDDLSASDLTGRYLIRGEETVWVDGPLTTAARHGAICYLDEVVEARQDTIVAIHPLSDDRRLLPIDKNAELVEAHPDFQLVVSYNPSHQNVVKDLKPSTRQRFVTIQFDFPSPHHEAEIVEHESGVDGATARSLVKLGERVRRLRDRGLVEAASTRLLVHAGCLVAEGLPLPLACDVAIAGPLSDDPELRTAVRDVIAALFP